MITAKDILNLKSNRYKKIAFSCFKKEYIINNLEYVAYANSYYSYSDGFGLEKSSKDNCDTLYSLMEVIKYNRLTDDEKLIFWDDDGSIVNFEEVLELEDIILFI